MPPTSHSPWLPLAGLVLALDGVVAWLLGVTALFMSTAVAAVEGRTGDPNSHLVWWAAGLFAAGLVAFVAAWRAVRRVFRGRLLGVPVLVAGVLIAGWGLWAGATAAAIDPAIVVLSAVILLSQLGALLAIVRSRRPRPDPATRIASEGVR